MDIQLEIIPYEGLNVLRFGATQQKVIEVLGHPHGIYDEEDEIMWDYDSSLCLHLRFSTNNNKLSSIEVIEPTEILLDGLQLMRKSKGEVISLFQRLDQELEIDSEGLISYSLDIGITWSEESGIVEAVAVEPKGAYTKGAYKGLEDEMATWEE